MKNIIKISLILSVVFSLSSCFKDVDTVKLEKPFETLFQSQHNIYGNITYFKVYEGITTEVSNKELGKWDLLFQSANEGDNVLINYSVSAKSITTGTLNFDEVDKSTVDKLFNEDWQFNDPAYSNIKDSLALKSWESGEVYLVYRGNAFPPEKAYYKIQFLEKTSTSYTFKYAHVEDTGSKTSTVTRSEGIVNKAFSFDDNKVVDFEPLIGDWDFFMSPYFGWYETLTAGEYSPYNLTGVMINNESGIEVAQVFDENIHYEDINLAMVSVFDFTDWKGAIGSTWKKIPDSQNPIYHMDESKKYIFKMVDGNYYKLRFLSFYNDEGVKGFTSFEILRLE